MPDLTPQQVLNWANLAKLVRDIPDDLRFEMETWGKPKEDTMCGTAACMAGHAALNPHFRELENPLYLDVHWNVEKKTGNLEVGNRNEVFGLRQNPFDPDWIRQEMFDEDDYVDDETGQVDWEAMQLTPEICAESIEAFVLHDALVSREDWKAAEDKATATYSEEWVHKLTPWNKEFDVDAYFCGDSTANGQITAKGWAGRDLS